MGQLAELKVISAGTTWYHSKDKSVNTRANQLPKLYRDKAVTIDTRFCGSSPTEVGPLQRRLKEFGDLLCLVVGQFGECSNDIHILLSKCAEEKAQKLQRASGCKISAYEKSQLLQMYRRRLSICAIRAQSSCLLSRLSHWGEGASQAARRRDQAKHQGELARQDIRAHWEANVRGRRIITPGLLHL